MSESSSPRTDTPEAGVDRADILSWVRLYHADLYRYAFRLAGNPADAEDLTQQAFLAAQQYRGELREPERARSWLFAILRNCFLKSHRRPTPLVAGDLELDIDGVPAAPASDWIDRQDLQDALNELPDEFRLVVLMFYFEDCSYREISERLSIPIGTVMSRLSRAKLALRARLTDDRAKTARTKPACTE